MKKLTSTTIAFIILLIMQTALLINNVNQLKAQGSNSPYSRYGIGEIGGRGFGQNNGMGGTGVAMQNDSLPFYFLNNGNPASYSNVRTTVIELGANVNRTQLESSSLKQNINNAAISYISLGIPLKKWWGASFGLVPYSSVGYKVKDHQEINNVGPVDFYYEGNGGINQFYLGNGIKPLYELPSLYLKSKRYERLRTEHKLAKSNRILNRKKALQNLSLGVNASYLFGTIENTKRAEFTGSNYFFNTNSGSSARIGDVSLDYGLQYAYTIDSVKGKALKDNIKLLFGATFTNQSSITAKIDSLTYTYYTLNGYEYVKDTVQYVPNAKGQLQLPQSFGIGLGFKLGTKLLVAADYKIQNWSTYKAFNKTQDLKNSRLISAGIQYVPNTKANGKGSYLKRVNYRIGGRYTDTPIELKNTQLKEYGITFGFGFPIYDYRSRYLSMINLGFELGQRGTTQNGLIKEQFARCTLGFTINDLGWFIKPKYD